MTSEFPGENRTRNMLTSFASLISRSFVFVYSVTVPNSYDSLFFKILLLVTFFLSIPLLSYIFFLFLFTNIRVAFFSADAIPAKVELCYDYGYYEGNVEGKSRKCLCGAIGCRNVLY